MKLDNGVLARRVPFCWVCKKSVEGFVRAKTATTNYVEFTALCHSQRESVQIPLELFQSVDGTEIDYGEAFKPAALLQPAPQPQLEPATCETDPERAGR